jgi:hypothetical protein
MGQVVDVEGRQEGSGARWRINTVPQASGRVSVLARMMVVFARWPVVGFGNKGRSCRERRRVVGRLCELLTGFRWKGGWGKVPRRVLCRHLAGFSRGIEGLAQRCSTQLSHSLSDEEPWKGLGRCVNGRTWKDAEGHRRA